MTAGFTSLVTGACVGTIEAATPGQCSGYPKAETLPGGTVRVTYCSGYAVGDAGYGGAFNGTLSVFDGETFVQEISFSSFVTGCDSVEGPWWVSPEDGALLAAAVVAVWLTGWALRMVRAAT